MRRALLTLIIGLGIGALGGAVYGWYLQGQNASAGLDHLHPDYKADYAVMVGAAYAENGDWDLAQERISRLALPDPAGYLALLAQQYIEQSRSPDDVRNLVRLAARYGYVPPHLQPYLAPPTDQP